MVGKIMTPLKEGDLARLVSSVREVAQEKSGAITFVRQAAEWGMGSIEVYRRLLHPLPYDKEKRKLRLDNLFRLANYRDRTVEANAYWIPARAVELYFEVAYRAVKESFDEASRPSLQVSVDAAKERWMAYVRERTQRSDRLRQKLVCTLWEWCRRDRFPDVDIELMIEPSMPGFSLEPLEWTPRTTD
ncbi:unnamed protein product [Phytophthora fragariaefolia]|uniref:Unnamed protein product n=1 Tax=Phytophthora fragariaefolia TaxID=1490495 RepID=A0A9W7CUE7_9STRA|nr:unnamed protein product [Phytophthora fragariaefolia]